MVRLLPSSYNKQKSTNPTLFGPFDRSDPPTRLLNGKSSQETGWLWRYAAVRLTGTFIDDDTLDKYYKLITCEKCMLFVAFIPKISSQCYTTASTNSVFITYNTQTGRDSAVGIASRYRMDGPRIEFRWGRNFSHHSRLALDPPSLLYNRYRLSFPGVKLLSRGVDHPSPSSAKVKEKVELYLCSSLWTVVACFKVNFEIWRQGKFSSLPAVNEWITAPSIC